MPLKHIIIRSECPSSLQGSPFSDSNNTDTYILTQTNQITLLSNHTFISTQVILMCIRAEIHHKSSLFGRASPWNPHLRFIPSQLCFEPLLLVTDHALKFQGYSPLLEPYYSIIMVSMEKWCVRMRFVFVVLSKNLHKSTNKGCTISHILLRRYRAKHMSRT